MKTRTLIFLLLVIPMVASGKHLHLESWYQERACSNGAKTLDNGREVDCMTQHYAIEFDFATKAYECAGQALYYAAKTGLKPGCVLIIEAPTDCRHLEIVQAINKAHPVKIQLWTTGAYQCQQ